MWIGVDASRAARAWRTGTENYSLYLIRALAAQGERHRFRLYFNEPPAEGLLARDERIEWRIMPFPRLWTHARLSYEMICQPPDVLFVPAHVLPIVHPRRSVVTIHDVGYLRYPQMHPRASRLYLDWSTRWNVRAAAHLVADSEATREDLIRFYRADPAKITVAYPAGTPGLAPVEDEARLAEVRARYGTGEAYFLYVGTLQPRKNLGALLEAYARLLARGQLPKEVRLVLAGRPGWLCEGILARAHQADLAGQVILPGYVATEDLAALLSGALAFVFPSWYEGFGLPVLEAMICGAPVIASNTSSLPEVVGDAALLINPAEVEDLAQAMVRLYDDEALRKDLSRRGRERARAFSWEACAARVLTVLEAVGEG